MLLRKTRILPIVLKDISHVSVSRGLRFILDTITFIKWPENGNTREKSDFWDRLRLSMPKLRVSDTPGRLLPPQLDLAFESPRSSTRSLASVLTVASRVFSARANDRDNNNDISRYDNEDEGVPLDINLEHAEEGDAAADESGDILGSSTQLLRLPAGNQAAQTADLLPNGVIDGSSSPQIEITCCTWV